MECKSTAASGNSSATWPPRAEKYAGGGCKIFQSKKHCKQAPLGEGLQDLCLPRAARSAASASREPSRLEIRELGNSSSTRNNYLPLFSSIAHAPNMLRLGLVHSMQTFHHFIYRSTNIPLVALLLFFLFLVVLILVLTQLLMRNAMDTACR